jgi:hypothetical protein
MSRHVSCIARMSIRSSVKNERLIARLSNTETVEVLHGIYDFACEGND